MSYYASSEFANDSNTPWYKALALMPERGKVLDVGCSSGNFGEVIIAKKNTIVDGVEMDSKDATIAKKKLRKVYNLNIETDDISSLDPDYDVIYLGDVIEHLVHPSMALERLKNNLNKEGAVVFSIPNMAHISVRLMLLAGTFKYGNTGLLDRTHLRYYDRSEIERVFHEAGYKIVDIDWVSRDIPRELLELELRKIGLVGNEKFFKHARQIDAGAYQYIGKAVPIDRKIMDPPRPTVSPEIDMFEKHLLDMRHSYEADVYRIEKKYEDKYIPENEELKRKVNDYEQSLSWKLTKPLRIIASIARRGGQKL
jgi:2-polyprenyl-3-methyl-5-hydroxy-6-metoxy-1,4-benzoquinol methylase